MKSNGGGVLSVESFSFIASLAPPEQYGVISAIWERIAGARKEIKRINETLPDLYDTHLNCTAPPEVLQRHAEGIAAEMLTAWEHQKQRAKANRKNALKRWQK